MRSGIDVGDIMTTKLAIAKPKTTVANAAKLANKYRVGGLPVINKDHKLVGIITERDVMQKVVAEDRKASKIFVEDIMTPVDDLITATPAEDMNSVAKKMHESDITRVPVITDDCMLVGIVTNRDILENSPKLIDLLLEQAKIKGPKDLEPIAIGTCERCGDKGTLLYKDGEFLCEDCISKL